MVKTTTVKEMDQHKVSLLPVEQYLAGLNRKRMSAGAVFRDDLSRVLLLKPSYKKTYEIPGGTVDADEAPWAAANREIFEELGLELPIGRLLVVDYLPARGAWPEGMAFLFDGGFLGEKCLANMTFSDSEILSAGFYSLAEARKTVNTLLADRIQLALAALAEGTTILSESGKRVT